MEKRKKTRLEAIMNGERNFVMGLIILFGSICLAMWFGGKNNFLDIILLIVMCVGVPLGLIVAGYPKDDEVKE